MIEETRHPHPHIDPRQPRDLSSLRTNPPVFAWKPGDATAPFGLIVASDEALKDVVLHADGLADPMFLPDGHDVTFGQMDPALKNRISHRANAMKKLLEALS